MRISDWSSDVCSSDLPLARLVELRLVADEEADLGGGAAQLADRDIVVRPMLAAHRGAHRLFHIAKLRLLKVVEIGFEQQMAAAGQVEPQIDLHLRKGRQLVKDLLGQERSEEHTSELQSLMRISYAVF